MPRYYVLNRLTLGSPSAAWWTSQQAGAGLRRKPWREEATPATLGSDSLSLRVLRLCHRILGSLQEVATTAAQNEDNALDTSDLNYFVQNATEVRRAKKEHAEPGLKISSDPS